MEEEQKQLNSRKRDRIRSRLKISYIFYIIMLLCLLGSIVDVVSAILAKSPRETLMEIGFFGVCFCFFMSYHVSITNDKITLRMIEEEFDKEEEE